MKVHRSHCCLTWSAFAAGAVFVVSPTLPAQEEYRPAAAGGYSMEAIDRLEPDLQIGLREIERLYREGKYAEAGKLRDSLQSEMARKLMLTEGVRLPEREDSQVVRKPDRPSKPLPPRAKVRHLRIAAKNLEAAGYHKQAAGIRAEIGRIEESVRREKTASGSRTAELKMAAELRLLRLELEELRGEIARLKSEAGSKPNLHDTKIEESR